MLDSALKPLIRHSLITRWFFTSIFLPPYFLGDTYIVHVWEAWSGVCKTIHFTTLFKTRDHFSLSWFISFRILNYFLTITWQNKILSWKIQTLLYYSFKTFLTLLPPNWLSSIHLSLSQHGFRIYTDFFPAQIHKKEMASIKQDFLLFSFSQKIQLHVFCLHLAMKSFIV